MRKKMLLFSLLVAMGLQIQAATLSVTNNSASGAGSFAQAFTDAVAGDIIVFNFDGTELSLTDAIPMKSITIDGFNTFNGYKVVLKQTTASKSFFTLAAGITATFKNIVFDGTGILGNTALTAANGSTLNVDACVFKNINAQANNGGAARIQGAATITSSLFENNITGGGYGGGALCVYNAATVTVDKCSFVGNTSNASGNSGGGAIVARGTVATACNVTITNSTFANNYSGKTGGAILSSVQSSTAYTANVTAVNCTFTGNQGDGAISALTTANGVANVFLVNALVVNNVNVAGDAYSDLLETAGTNAATVVKIDLYNVMYTTASTTVVTTGRNCIQVADPATAVIFKSLETFATSYKRPVLSEISGNKIAELITGSLALNAGVATLAGYTIPSVDQLGATRPATPSIGAVEYVTGTTVISEHENNKLTVRVEGRMVAFTGIEGNQELLVYSMGGQLTGRYTIGNEEPVQLSQPGLVLMKIQNNTYKVVVR
jgi:predicted outer membrane repeat protein